MKFKLLSSLPIIIFTFTIVFSCQQKSGDRLKGKTLFESVSADSSHIFFSNNITSNDSVNLFTFEYLYNGGGVGIGDFNNDGLSDAFFIGNQVASKIYLNKGHFKFEDITENSGIKLDKNCPFGVSIVDINQDGFLDIYVSIGGESLSDIYPNKLFVNQGLGKDNKPKFKEMAEEYGLADAGQSIQGLFFDYDRDGDLDMYQLTGGGFDTPPNVPHPILKDGSAQNTDKLYRNDFDKKLGHPIYSDVSKQAGIVEEGFGLGVSMLDINDDGWQDLYITNDYLSNDFLYINNKKGGFSEQIQQYFKHTSHFAMGNDVGDINNDGLIDILAVDMLPDEHYQRLQMFGPNQYDKFQYGINLGYGHQYMRNTLQLNRGMGKFSEIGQLAGIYKTSWSWSPLFADLDNDGFQDIFISNGFGKNITDLDFVKFRSNATQTLSQNEQNKILLDSLSKQKGIKTHPYCYKNNGDLTFSDVSSDWGMDLPTYSNGAAYVDLDNDGDLDIITNNIDERAHIYKNTTIENSKNDNHNFLKIKLKGTENNRSASGSKIVIKYANQIQTRNLSTVRGFESSVDETIHFGLGKVKMIDSLIINWADGKQSILTKIKSNQTKIIHYDEAKKENIPTQIQSNNTLLTEVNPKTLNIDYRNKNVEFNDFNYEYLLPRKYSQNGPCLAVGDVNGDGLEDFFVGGIYQKSGEVFLQTKNSKFVSKPLMENNDYSQDAGSLFFDADGDGDLDLYVVSGGNEFADKDPRYQDRLFKNDGKGNFSNDLTALPEMFASGSVVTANDFDKDGDLDLFVGGTITPGLYPQTPTSYILQNNHGQFLDVTDKIAPYLGKIGMVNSAVWTDFDNDGNTDLMVVGEWMPITIFKNSNGKLVNYTNNLGLQNSEGWWQSISSGDFDNDGDTDYVLGNWGRNTPYKVSQKEPMSVNYKDFDQNGSIDPIISYYEKGINYPVASWDFMTQQIPFIRKQFPTYASYSSVTTENLLSKFEVNGMQTLSCKTLNSSYLQNNGKGKFTLKTLPTEAQFSPIFGITTNDINHDGNLDIITVGNFYGTEVVTGRYDASTGLVMIGDGKGNFKSVNLSKSGFIVDGDAKAIRRVELSKNKALFLVTQNNDALKVFIVNDKLKDQRKN